MRMKIFLIFAICTIVGVDAKSDVIVNNGNNTGQLDWRQSDEYREAQEIAILENDIRLLDMEIEKCKKKKTGWTVATVVGGVGVVATGVGAIVQANKISDKKAELANKQAELNDAKQELKDMK